MNDRTSAALIETFESQRNTVVCAGALEFSTAKKEGAFNKKVILCGYDPVLSPMFVYQLVQRKYEIMAVADDERAGEKVFRHRALSSHELGTKPLPEDGLLLNCATHNGRSYSNFERIAAALDRPIINFQQLAYLSREHDTPLNLTIDPGYYLKSITDNGDRFLSVLPLLNDERSREILLQVMLGRLTTDYSWFWKAYSPVEDMYFPTFFNYRDDETFVDAGAFDGKDTLRFLRRNRFHFDAVHLFEIAPPNLKRIANTLDEIDGTGFGERIHVLPVGLWKEKTQLTFKGEGLYAMLATIQPELADGRDLPCQVTDLDSAIDTATLIKFEIEGAEMPALKGAKGIITKCRPKMAISAYHLSYDIVDIIEYLRSLDVGYRFRIRHHWGSDIRTIVYAATDFNADSSD